MSESRCTLLCKIQIHVVIECGNWIKVSEMVALGVVSLEGIETRHNA